MRSLSSAIALAILAMRDKANELRSEFGDETRARTLEWAAARIESAQHTGAAELLTLAADGPGASGNVVSARGFRALRYIYWTSILP